MEHGHHPERGEYMGFLETRSCPHVIFARTVTELKARLLAVLGEAGHGEHTHIIIWPTAPEHRAELYTKLTELQKDPEHPLSATSADIILWILSA